MKTWISGLMLCGVLSVAGCGGNDTPGPVSQGGGSGDPADAFTGQVQAVVASLRDDAEPTDVSATVPSLSETAEPAAL